MIRRHRIDTISLSFHISQYIELCQLIEDLIGFRNIMRFFLCLKSGYKPYPTGQA